MKNYILLGIISFISLSLIVVKPDKKGQCSPNSESYKIDSLKHYIAVNEKILALVNVMIVDGTGNAPCYDQIIIVKNGRFKKIGDRKTVTIPKEAKILNLEGKTIIPGIVGVHNHLHIPRFPFVGNIAAKLYLASGVTTIQTCGAASPLEEIDISKRIASLQAPGPDIVTSAPFINGEGGNPNMVIPRSQQHIRDTMQFWINKGVKWFKVYRNTKPEHLKVIIDEAHKNNCKVTGHLCSITFEEAIKLGIDGIEHGFNSISDFRTNKAYGVCDGGREYIDELEINSPEVKRIQQLMIDSGVHMNSTLAIYEASIPNRAYADERSLKVMSPYLISQYENRRKFFDKKVSDSTRNKRLKRIMAFEYQFNKMGGLLGCGVDAGRHVVPGYGDQRNFELLREARFTTEQAIKVMTSNGAKILNLNNVGTIEEGKRADFVILNGDLDTDISVIRNVENVFKNGIGYDPRTLIEDTNGQLGIE